MSDSDLKIIAIAAMNENRVIGSEQSIPWHIPGEQKRFAELTKGHSVVMGRKTYNSLPEKVRPLPDRKNIVFSKSSSNSDFPAGVDVYNDVDDFFTKLVSGELSLPTNILWIIGGDIIYRKTLQYCNEVCLTLVHGKQEGDAYFPEFESEFVLRSSDNFDTHSYLWYDRKRAAANM